MRLVGCRWQFSQAKDLVSCLRPLRIVLFLELTYEGNTGGRRPSKIARTGDGSASTPHTDPLITPAPLASILADPAESPDRLLALASIPRAAPGLLDRLKELHKHTWGHSFKDLVTTETLTLPLLT